MKKLLLGILKQNYSFSAKKYQLVKSLIATLFLFLSGLNFGLYAQNTLNNVGMTSVASSGGAYSLRKLSSAYTGNAILVRRSSDNTTQNIGFTPAGLLDETTLLAFVGSGNGFVQTWYDQSGFNRHVKQSTLASQPRIVNAGVIERQNGVPSVYFTGSSFLTHTSFQLLDLLVLRPI